MYKCSIDEWQALLALDMKLLKTLWSGVAAKLVRLTRIFRVFLYLTYETVSDVENV